MRLFETSTAGRVDAKQGYIYGVKLIGLESKNNRTYTRDALTAAIPKYEGCKVYLNHPDSRSIGEDRKFQDWIGRVENVKLKPDGLYGDIRLRRESPLYSEVIEAALEFPDGLGCSHVAEGDSKFIDGREVIDHIEAVHSVDLVMEPATTAGLFESETSDAQKAIALAKQAFAIFINAAKLQDRTAQESALVELEAINEQMAVLVGEMTEDCGDYIPGSGKVQDDYRKDESYQWRWNGLSY